MILRLQKSSESKKLNCKNLANYIQSITSLTLCYNNSFQSFSKLERWKSMFFSKLYAACVWWTRVFCCCCVEWWGKIYLYYNPSKMNTVRKCWPFYEVNLVRSLTKCSGLVTLCTYVQRNLCLHLNLPNDIVIINIRKNMILKYSKKITCAFYQNIFW